MVGLPAFAGFPFPNEASDALPIPAPGLALWLDAARGVARDGATTRLTSWASRVGPSVASQATTALMPLVALMNGLPSVQFDGADDLLGVSNAATLANASTIFAVTAPSATTGNHSIFAGGATTFLDLDFAPLRVRLLHRTAGAILDEGSTPRAAGQAVLVCAAYDRAAGTASLRTNRVPVASAGGLAYPATTHAQDAIGGQGGGNDRYAGLLSEMIVYLRTLSATEITQVEAYLAAKWGTA